MKINKNKYLVEAPVRNIDDVAELDGQDLKNKIIAELHANGFDNAANQLNKLDVRQFQYFAESFGKNAFSDDENIFLTFLNNSYAGAVLKNFKIFTLAYNVLIGSEFYTNEYYEWIKDGNPDNCIVFWPSLYTSVGSVNKMREIIKLDYGYKVALGEGLKSLNKQALNEEEYAFSPGGLWVPKSAIGSSSGPRPSKSEILNQRNNLRKALKDHTIDKFLSANDIKPKKDEPEWATKEKNKLRSLSKEERFNYVKELHKSEGWTDDEVNAYLRSRGF